MKILAIFDCEDIDSAFKGLRKLQHSIKIVPTINKAIDRLKKEKYDVILCQPYLGAKKVSAAENLRILKDVIVQNDIPFICCDATSDLSDNAAVEMTAQIHMLGGQGIIVEKTFHSRNLVHHILRHLNVAVGTSCVTTSMF